MIMNPHSGKQQPPTTALGGRTPIDRRKPYVPNPATIALVNWIQASARGSGHKTYPSVNGENSADWLAMKLTKTTTGEYFGAGPLGASQTPMLWDRPVALDPLALPFVGARGSDGEAAGPFKSVDVREPQFTELEYSATQTAGGHMTDEFFIPIGRNLLKSPDSKK